MTGSLFVTAALETLRELLVIGVKLLGNQAKFISGVGDEVKKVESDLRTIHALLMEADANRSRLSESPILKNCIAELNELASKAEIVMETHAFASMRASNRVKKIYHRVVGIFQELYTLRGVGKEIGDIRSRLADLTGQLRAISLGGEGSSTSVGQEYMHQQRLRYAHEVDRYFVGMVEDIGSLVPMVKDNSPNAPSLISICGMGGLGKTTLVRKIYNHPDIIVHFDCRAWVCVTQQFHSVTVLRAIFRQIDVTKDDEIKKMDLEQLVTGLHESLAQKKCLVVLDDIWESVHWDILKVAIPTENCKVVLTTRIENVTSHECHVYHLGSLNEEEGWELLRKIALPVDGDEAQVSFQSTLQPFEDIGRQMVKKCGFLPLAISVIGGILRHKSQLLEWEEVSTNMDSYLKYGVGIKKDNRIEQILDLSFDALPLYLKPCFLYLACFPEDEEIDAQQLYLLWMGEGLISLEHKGNHETLKNVAERYLSELAFRCMVQVKRCVIDINRKFISCRLHDLMRDLCSAKAEEEAFIIRLDISKYHQNIPSSIRPSIHKLIINVIDDDVLVNTQCLHDVKDLRSLILLNKHEPITCFESKFDFENSKQLRILFMDGFSFSNQNIPSVIGKLIHLKFLSLSGSNVERLPKRVCYLPFLQTLDLSVLFMKLPNKIWKMKMLKHLSLPMEMEVIGGGKLRLEGLELLETLEGVNSKTACITDIINLRNLRNLIATIEEDEESLATIVDYMSNRGCQLFQTEIIITHCNLRDVVNKMVMIQSLISLKLENCKIERRFPTFHHLVVLYISNCEMDVVMVDVLGKFPMLQSLTLKGDLGDLGLQTELIFSANSFLELKELSLVSLENLQKWEIEKEAMPKLLNLEILDCINLEKLPDGVRFISTLEILNCFGMSEEFKARMRRDGGEDYANFSHIPNLRID